MTLVSISKCPIARSVISKAHTDDTYYPLDGRGNLVAAPIVNYLVDRGFTYDAHSGLWYCLDSDNMYYPVSAGLKDPDFPLKLEIDNLVPDGVFVTTNFKNSVIAMAASRANTLKIREDYLVFVGCFEGMKYDTTRDYEMIQFRNGVFDPYTGELLPNTPFIFEPDPYPIEYREISEDLLRYGEMSVYDDFYMHIFPDRETLDYFLYWIGSCMFDIRPLPAFLLIYGPGGTGKTSVTDAVTTLMTTARVGNQSMRQLLSRFGTSGLVGKRLNIWNETETSSKADFKGLTTMVKQLVGTQHITVEEKYRSSYEATINARLLITGNTLPEMDTSDSGLIRRVRVIIFDKIQNTDLSVLSSQGGLLWLFNACRWAWLRHTHPNPSAALTSIEMVHDQEPGLVTAHMKKACNDYLMVNGFNGWLADYCGSMDRGTVRAGLANCDYTTAYNSYLDYVREFGGQPRSKAKWGEILKRDYGLERASGRNGVYFIAR